MNVNAAFAKLSEADIIALPIAQTPEVETEIVIMPVPASAAPIDQAAANLGRSAPDCLWKYFDSNRNLLFAVAPVEWSDRAKIKGASGLLDSGCLRSRAFCI